MLKKGRRVMPSPFRFVTSNKSGEYSVWRGESTKLGFVTKIEHRIQGRTTKAGWTPTTEGGAVLPIEKTQKAAAEALWRAHQASGR